MIKSFFKKNPTIATIRLSGVISARSGMLGSSGINLAEYEQSIEKAFTLSKVKAVSLIINSPGGSPVQSALIAGRIRQLAKEKNIPVYAFIEDLAASGGYWLACAADEIFAMEGSIVGSIGVITSGFGAVEAIKKIGIERRVYYEGNSKGMLDPFLPEQKDDIIRLKEIQKDLHEQFVSWVKDRRGRRLKGSDKELFNANIWTGLKANKLGLIDGLGDYQSILQDRFGDKVKIRDFTKKPTWFKKRFSFGSNIHKTSNHFTDGVLNTLENRIHWARFGF